MYCDLISLNDLLAINSSLISEFGGVSSLDILSSITDYRKYDTEENRLDEDVLIRII